MRIGFWLESDGLNNVDFSNVECGNPGCGGTEFLNVLLMKLLIKRGFEVFLFSSEPIKGLPGITYIKVDSLETALNCFDNPEDKGKFIIGAIYASFLTKIKLNNTHLFLWYHLDADGKTINSLKQTNITHVFLTKEQSKNYYQYPNIINKSVVIPNANISNYPNLKRNMELNNVTFLGSIVPGKNLDILLEIWPKVLEKIQAKLIVVGTGKVYSKKAKLGPNNIAEKDYENKLFTLIKRNHIEQSVIFMGLKSYKEFEEEIAPITKLGIVNPAFPKSERYPETFCLSATQMGSFGIPVIGGNLNGLKETLPKKCGYRINNTKELISAIVKLLVDNHRNIKYGLNYKKYILSHYDVSIFEKKWSSLLNDSSINYNKYYRLIPFVVLRAIKRFLLNIKRFMKPSI